MGVTTQFEALFHRIFHLLRMIKGYLTRNSSEHFCTCKNIWRNKEPCATFWGKWPKQLLISICFQELELLSKGCLAGLLVTDLGTQKPRGLQCSLCDAWLGRDLVLGSLPFRPVGCWRKKEWLFQHQEKCVTYSFFWLLVECEKAPKTPTKDDS